MLCAPPPRKRLGLAALSRADPVARQARRHSTSRKFARAQRERTRQALDVAFAEGAAGRDVPPVSKTQVRRFALAIARCFAKTVVDMFSGYHQLA